MTDPDPDRDTDRLRELLDRAAPASPDLTPMERTAAVARRGRAARRRDRVLAGAASAALAVVVVLPFALRDGDDAPVVAAPAPPAAADPCPDRPIDVSGPPAAADLGSDVVWVRSCPADGQVQTLASTPVLGTAAAAFVADVLALPAYTLPPECAAMMVMPDPWALVLGRADGEPVVVGSSVRACGGVVVDGVERDPAFVIAAFERRLGAEPPSCPTDPSLGDAAVWDEGFDLADTRTVVACYRDDPMGSRDYAAEAGVLSPAQRDTVVSDLSSLEAGVDDPSSCFDTGPQRLLVLQDGQGRTARLLDTRCTGDFRSTAGTWSPSDAAEQAIADALGGRVRR